MQTNKMCSYQTSNFSNNPAWTSADSLDKLETIFGICSGVKCFECPLSRNLTPSGNDGLIGISLSKEIGFPYRKKSGFSILYLAVKVDILEIDLIDFFL